MEGEDTGGWGQEEVQSIRKEGEAEVYIGRRSPREMEEEEKGRKLSVPERE